MNKTKKSTQGCSDELNFQRGDKKSDNAEQASHKKYMKLDVGNSSAQYSHESRVSGHSTPIHRRDYTFDVEDSPELDYRCSPISLPCTQDGGNEIAWDWQTSNSKSSNDRVKTQNNHIETPKRTKQLQKKRNSNSPLLQKPLKRKQVKRENIENIGKLTAELRALSERMKSMQDTFKDHGDNKEEEQYEFASKLLIEVDEESSDNAMADVFINNEKCNVDHTAVSSESKKSCNYDDLFDDSIDDSMVKCSQEIEEKLNLCKSKQTDIAELSTVSEERESSSTSEKESYCLAISKDSTESFKNSKSSSIDTSVHLKTYSNNSSKQTSMFRTSMSNSKHLNNNVINVSDKKQKLQDKTVVEFPDDSFDDCLATCIEDDKLISKLSEYDFSPSSSRHNVNHSRRSSKQVGANTSNNKKISINLFSKPVVQNDKSTNSKNSIRITDELVDEVEVINDKEAIRKLFPGKNALENRKFFKTKSLSDQWFYQNRNPGTISKSLKISNSAVESQNPSQINSVNSSVSTTFPIVRGQTLYNNNFSSINGMGNAYTLNRLEEKGVGDCIVKYKSTSNLNNVKEVKDSQSVQCTPEEIERKRLEAKMKLEAKRKLQQTSIRTADTSLGVPVNKCVQR